MKHEMQTETLTRLSRYCRITQKWPLYFSLSPFQAQQTWPYLSSREWQRTTIAACVRISCIQTRTDLCELSIWTCSFCLLIARPLQFQCNITLVWALRRRCNNWLLLSHKTDLVCHINWGPRNYNEGGCTEVLWFSLNSSDVTVFAGACTERKMAHQTRPSREWLAPHLARAARFSVRTGFWEPAFCKWHGIRYLVNKSCLCSQQLPGYLRGSRLIWKKSLILEKYWLSASKVSF